MVGKRTAGWESRVEELVPETYRLTVQQLVLARVKNHSSVGLSQHRLAVLARRAGLAERDAIAWSRAAGAAARWPEAAIGGVPRLGDVKALDSFVIQCLMWTDQVIRAGEAAVARPKTVSHSGRRRRGGPTGPVSSKSRKAKPKQAKSKQAVPGKTSNPRRRAALLAAEMELAQKRAAAIQASRGPRPEPRKGALLPPKPALPGRPAVASPNPNRPVGWETTDWISSKS